MAQCFEIPKLEAIDLDSVSEKAHVADIHHHLITEGILKINLRFHDPTSQYLEAVIRELKRNHNHGLPITHSSTRGWFWDVKPTLIDEASSDGAPIARSETFESFPWHTDCSYEESVPRFVGLHVIEHDKKGGGILSVLPVARLLDIVSAKTIDQLGRPEYLMKVPPEFIKGNHTETIGSILCRGSSEAFAPLDSVKDGETPRMQSGTHLFMRLRADIIQPLTPPAAEALGEIQRCLDGPSNSQSLGIIQLTSKKMPRNSLVLMDNCRWLHSRGNIKDPNRHLRRVRWHSQPFRCETLKYSVQIPSSYSALDRG